MKAHKLVLAMIIVLALFLVRPTPQVHAAWGITIDDFGSDLAVMAWPPTFQSPNWATNLDRTVLGGERDIYVERTSGSSAILAESSAADSHMAHGQNPGVYGYSIVSWDGRDHKGRTLNTAGLGGIDLTRPGGASDAIGLYVKSCDLGARVVVTVYTNDPTGADWSRAALVVPASTYNTWFYLRYANDFHKQGGAGVTWTNVGAITLMIDGRDVADLDITMDVIAFGQAPTAIDLVSFTAAPAQKAIHVEWETASEIDNLGFNLYRAESAGGPWTRLNDSLIPSQVPGIPAGAVYTFEDSDVGVGVTYYYRLEDVDIHGHGTFHGPVEATLKSGR